jgi:type IV pilus assembly protein PilO
MERFFDIYLSINAKQRLLVLMALLVAIVSGYYYFIHQTKENNLSKKENEYREIEAQRAEKQAYLDNLTKYEARFKQLREDLEIARSLLPDDPDVPQLLAKLGNAGRRAGLLIQTFEPKSESQKQFFQEISFGMSVEGSYHEISNFIDAVGQLDRIVTVNNLSMTSPTLKNQKIVLSSSFDIKTYSYKQ